ncbi:sugar transferase [Ornithinimicrobium pekingense]|uniref:sugar transferase n=1 Tax=Ornithinimicrobium pekingense TaxID=384677 RepID=UPI00146C0AAD|nr:sugar transferase [Ornithinimicrobium pekingense]
MRRTDALSLRLPLVSRFDLSPTAVAAPPADVHPHAGSPLKRCGDLTGGLVLLVFFLLMLPVAAVLIRLDSPGTVIYRQTRVGLHGVPFTIYKFRTMCRDAEADGRARWAQEGDPRVTRCGRFLRATRLDEVPQAINVLRGEMSLVGPRPERPELTDVLVEQHANYLHRLTIKPGLTGLAQVKHRYTSSMEDWRRKLSYDLAYARWASHRLDLCILLRTIRVVLTMRGT